MKSAKNATSPSACEERTPDSQVDVIGPQNYSFPEGVCGRPKIDRTALLRAFIAKAVLNITDNKFFRERLLHDYTLRRICGFDERRKVPCLATFSNAFREISESGLASFIHEQLVSGYLADELLENISRDATAIPAREKAAPKPKSSDTKPPKSRDRPKTGERRETTPSRIDMQPFMTTEEMIADLPVECDFGTKKNAKGVKETWRGYKLHLDVTDHGIPISAILTSASTHDSQAAIPLEAMTSERVTSLYTLMDAGYVSAGISDYIKDMGKIPVTAPKKPRGGEIVPLDPAKARRFKARTVVERANARIKDDLAGSKFRVRGAAKIGAHLGFSILALAAEQIGRYIL